MNALSRIRLALVSGFGIGWLPASGTITSAIAAILIWKHPAATARLFSIEGVTTLLPLFIVAIIVSAVLITTTEEDYRKRVSIDNFLGMILVFAFVPASPKMVIMGFALYRFFDIVKPWPIHYFTDMKSGIGVLLDNIVAGLLASGSLVLIKLAYGELMSYL